jgi:hypothetical protein
MRSSATNTCPPLHAARTGRARQQHGRLVGRRGRQRAQQRGQPLARGVRRAPAARARQQQAQQHLRARGAVSRSQATEIATCPARSKLPRGTRCAVHNPLWRPIDSLHARHPCPQQWATRKWPLRRGARDAPGTPPSPPSTPCQYIWTTRLRAKRSLSSRPCLTRFPSHPPAASSDPCSARAAAHLLLQRAAGARAAQRGQRRQLALRRRRGRQRQRRQRRLRLRARPAPARSAHRPRLPPAVRPPCAGTGALAGCAKAQGRKAARCALSASSASSAGVRHPGRVWPSRGQAAHAVDMAMHAESADRAALQPSALAHSQ